MTILGDAGVGKTRLVREFWERLGARSPEPLPANRTMPLVRGRGRLLAFGRGAQGASPDPRKRSAFGRARALGSREILGLTFGLDVAQDLHPLAARDRFQDAWVDFLGEVASERTTVMLIEDIHWGEELLLDLLERLLGM